jgi:hypothetical protein
LTTQMVNPAFKALQLEKDGLPVGYFSEYDIAIYRDLAGKVPNGGLIVEIGVFRGRSLCSIGPACRDRGIHMWAIDPWYGLDDLARAFIEAVAHFGLRENVMTIRSPAHVAAPFFAPQSIDLVYIDGPHDYDNVMQDIRDWLPRVKPGGWIGGHDYCSDWPDVERAVRATFGPDHSAPDKRSGCWFKQV